MKRLLLVVWIGTLGVNGLHVYACGSSPSDPYSGSCPESQSCSLSGVALEFKVADQQADFFERPWPADLRRTGTGTIDLAGFPNPTQSSLLADWLITAEENTRGFGTNSAIYFAFDGALDPDSLPGPAQSVSESATVFLVDLSDGPDRGQKIPLAVSFLESERQFTPQNTLVLRPVLGFPLRSNTRYAAVVTRTVKSKAGNLLGAVSDFERTKYKQAPENVAVRQWWDLLNPTYDELEQMNLVERGNVAALTVFTTQNVVEEMDRIRDFVAERPVPAVSDWQQLAERDDVFVYEGWFEMPGYQAGTPPDFEGGGGFVFDGDGTPLIQRTEQIAFTLAVPKDTPPQAGWPLVMYHHGTGGSRFSFCNSSTDVCDLLARKKIASIGIDQPMHAERNPWGRDETTITFNINNVQAFRDNFRQGGADLLVLRRMIEGLAVPAGISATGQQVDFDNSKVAYMGHSQGGISGPIYLGTAKDVVGAVLSAAGGGLNVVILERQDPIDIRGALVLVMMLEDSEFDLEHPIVNLFQTFAERADQLNYARRYIQEPPQGSAAKHLFYSEGLHDAMTMPKQIENLAAVSGCALMKPVTREFESMLLRGVTPLDPPVSGNASGPAGQPVTAVLAQYPDDGHYAIFDNPDAIRHYTDFMESLMYSEVPSVGP
jgi:pimeloyl-ACP methyl ester carboxylesterase